MKEKDLFIQRIEKEIKEIKQGAALDDDMVVIIIANVLIRTYESVIGIYQEVKEKQNGGKA